MSIVLVWDLDGTIVDSARLMVELIEQSIAAAGLPEVSLSSHIVGPPLEKTLTAFGYKSTEIESILWHYLQGLSRVTSKLGLFGDFRGMWNGVKRVDV